MNNRFVGFALDVLLPGMRSASTIRDIGIKATAILQIALLGGIYLAMKNKGRKKIEPGMIVYAWFYSQLVLLVASYAIR